MTETTINISPEVGAILNAVRTRNNLKDENEAITRIVLEYGKEMDEPELRPEYIERLEKIEKEDKFTRFNSVEELKKSIENA